MLSPRVWGDGVVAIHDSLWASRCVQVVRPGGEVTPGGPALYLLLREKQLVEFDLARVIKHLHWLNPRVLRLRIVTRSRRDFSEFVHADESGALIGVDRSYGHSTDAHAQAWMTGDASLAREWASSSDGAGAHASFRKQRRALECAPARTVGNVCQADGGEGAEAWLSRAVAAWRKPNAIYSGVYEYAPGVWAHESSTIEPGATVVAPSWIGRGVTVPADAVLVGPLVVRDGDAPPESAPEVDWDEVKSSHWNLKPLGSDVGARLLLKRAFDIAFSLFVIVCTLPIYPVVMLLIFIEDGRPFFFAHTRQTLGGRNFPCVKFRSMYRDAEKRKLELSQENASDGPQFHMKNDPRVLKIGAFLRASHLDELPQFWNVLLGHMSVVGPRPSPDEENQFCPTWREARLSVRPGITGLWQIKRTREPLTDFQEWIRYDLEYVQHQSFARDFVIIMRTLEQMVRRS